MAAGSIDDEGFRERVKKTFGNLFSNSTAASPLPNTQVGEAPALWSLTDEEVEKRKWRRDESSNSSYDRDSTPCSSSFDGLVLSHRNRNRRKRGGGNDEKKLIEDDLGDLDVEDDDGRGGDDWDIRSTIGLDPTLDNEDEEDVFDKVAIGRENADGRFYMGDIKKTNHQKQNESRFSSLEDSYLQSGKRDPRANHRAARLRLKEDEDALPPPIRSFEDRPQCLTKMDQINGKGAPPFSSGQAADSGSCGGTAEVKPILKRKEHDADNTASKSQAQKRVRFDSSCDLTDTSAGLYYTMKPNISSSSDKKVPDYILNPSKYQCYNLESTKPLDGGVEDQGNFVKLAKGSSDPEPGAKEDTHVVPPGSVTFIPKNCSSAANKVVTNPDSEMVQMNEDHNHTSESKHSSTLPVIIAAGTTEDSIANYMDVDEPETVTADKSTNFKKPSRQYRAKTSGADDSESV